MELYTKKSLFTFIDEEKKNGGSPLHHHHHHFELQSARNSISKEENPHFNPTEFKLIPPPSPESPWNLSPVPTPISPSLLFNCIASLHRQEGNIYSIACSNGLVFTGSDSTRVRVWKQPDCTEQGCIKSGSGEIRAISAYGNTLFTSHKDRKIRTWNFNNSVSTTAENFRSRKISTIPTTTTTSFFLFNRAKKTQQQTHKDFITCMAYYHAEGLLFTGSLDRTVKAWRISDNKCADSFTAHEDSVNGIVVNQEDGGVFTCSSDGSVKIWRRVYRENSHTLTMTLKFRQSPIKAIALGGKNNVLYSGCCDGTISYWEKEKMSYRFNHRGVLQGHSFAVLCLVVVEKMIFSGSEDTTIRIWRKEAEEGGKCHHECLGVLEGHRGPVRSLDACLEIEFDVIMGVLVYSASMDQTLKVWRVKVLDEKMGRYNEEGGNSIVGKKMRNVEDEISPVLSPSWVEKKLQGLR